MTSDNGDHIFTIVHKETYTKGKGKERRKEEKDRDAE